MNSNTICPVFAATGEWVSISDELGISVEITLIRSSLLDMPVTSSVVSLEVTSKYRSGEFSLAVDEDKKAWAVLC